MPRVYISIGSNIEREKNIRGAVLALKSNFGSLALSRVYENKAEGFDGNDFYNLAAGFSTELPVEQVGAVLLQIETAHGRTRGETRHVSRTLDIDLLLYGNLIRHDTAVDVPRDEIQNYAFVLGPLAELCPGLMHPLTGERIADMWQRFPYKNTLRHIVLPDLAGGK